LCSGWFDAKYGALEGLGYECSEQGKNFLCKFIFSDIKTNSNLDKTDSLNLKEYAMGALIVCNDPNTVSFLEDALVILPFETKKKEAYLKYVDRIKKGEPLYEGNK